MTSVENAFMDAEEARISGVLFARFNPELFHKAPAFGAAGGPEAWHLTDEGLARVYDMAAIYRLKMSASRAKVLECVAAAGPAGMSHDQIPNELRDAAFVLSLSHIDKDAEAQSIAAGLLCDQTRYNALQEASLLIRSITDENCIPLFVITALGKSLIQAAKAVQAAAVKEMSWLSINDLAELNSLQQPGFSG